MKKLYVNKFIIAICVIAGYVTTHAGDNVTLKRNRYPGQCQYNAPLTTSERCSTQSWIGRAAIDCAIREALNDCRSDRAHFNYECHVVTESAYPFSSTEFMGYRGCMGRVMVHGYEKK